MHTPKVEGMAVVTTGMHGRGSRSCRRPRDRHATLENHAHPQRHFHLLQTFRPVLFMILMESNTAIEMKQDPEQEVPHAEEITPEQVGGDWCGRASFRRGLEPGETLSPAHASLKCHRTT